MRWSLSCTPHKTRIFSTASAPRLVPAESGSAPENPGNWINWNGCYGETCRIDGAERYETLAVECGCKILAASEVTANFRRQLLSLCGCTNQSAFHNWHAGEALLIEAGLSLPFENDLGQNLVELTCRFAIRPNRNSVVWNGTALTRARSAAGNISGASAGRIR